MVVRKVKGASLLSRNGSIGDVRYNEVILKGAAASKDGLPNLCLKWLYWKKATEISNIWTYSWHCSTRGTPDMVLG